ncbi:hypothetical protein F4777DRAFT_396645 [Nemania sp. FL0916]|nr:hypothetical protein F4777DRAFT_396645 [Nemania sp. FL0916]
MATESIPEVSATLRLEPSIYSLSSGPPTLCLELTSHHNCPITIITDRLGPGWMLRNGTALIITDLTSNCIIEQNKRKPCFIPPPPRVSVPLIESHICTLYPDQPQVFSAPFNVKFRHRLQNGSLVESSTLGRAQGESPDTDRTPSSDPPLVLGHRYMVSLSDDGHLPWHKIRWWEYGTKQELLERGLNGRTVKHGPAPHGGLHVEKLQIKPIIFTCTE